jgi:hypothetical protein
VVILTRKQFEKILKQFTDFKGSYHTLPIEGHAILMNYQLAFNQFLELHPLQFTSNPEKVDFDNGIVSGTVADIAKIIQDKVLLANDELSQSITKYTNAYPNDITFCNTLHGIGLDAIEKKIPKGYFD